MDEGERLNVLDLFSGIGGFSLGLERAGMRTVAFCEIEPFCRRVLKKHWPNVPIYDDIRELTADRLRSDGIPVDVICGGFPCQDISVAGRGAGIEGERSGLWKEYSRLIGELRPRYAIVENVAALLNRGLDVVLGDLAKIGFDAEWHCIPASAVGAPHRRDRIWIVGHPNACLHARELDRAGNTSPASGSEGADDCKGKASNRQRIRNEFSAASSVLAHPRQYAARPGEELDGNTAKWGKRGINTANSSEDVAHPIIQQWDRRSDWLGWWSREPQEALSDAWQGRWQEDGVPIPQSLLGRVADGLPDRVHRLKALGNAVVPQIPEIIGRAIMQAEAERLAAA